MSSIKQYVVNGRLCEETAVKIYEYIDQFSIYQGYLQVDAAVRAVKFYNCRNVPRLPKHIRRVLYSNCTNIAPIVHCLNRCEIDDVREWPEFCVEIGCLVVMGCEVEPSGPLRAHSIEISNCSVKIDGRLLVGCRELYLENSVVPDLQWGLRSLECESCHGIGDLPGSVVRARFSECSGLPKRLSVQWLQLDRCEGSVELAEGIVELEIDSYVPEQYGAWPSGVRVLKLFLQEDVYGWEPEWPEGLVHLELGANESIALYLPDSVERLVLHEFLHVVYGRGLLELQWVMVHVERPFISERYVPKSVRRLLLNSCFGAEVPGRDGLEVCEARGIGVPCCTLAANELPPSIEFLSTFDHVKLIAMDIADYSGAELAQLKSVELVDCPLLQKRLGDEVVKSFLSAVFPH